MQIKTSVKYYFTSTHLEKLSKIVLSVGEDVNQQEFLHIAGGSEIGTANWENVLVFYSKVEHFHTFLAVKSYRLSCMHTPGYNLGSFQ